MATMERLTMGVLKSLEKRPSIFDVVLEEKAPAETYTVNAWETNNSCFLPPDLKQFYLASNGFLLTWKARIKDDVHPIGRMEINPLEKLEKLSTGTSYNMTTPSLADIDERSTDKDDAGGRLPHFDSRSRIFELDPCRDVGKVCLVYKNTASGVPAHIAEFWFLDRALRWHFLASSFGAYFRVMLLHLGLPHWPYLFTDIGLCLQAKQWYNIYSPDRLELDEADEVEGKGTGSAAGGEVTHDAVVGQLDVNRIFRGKTDKKKSSVIQGVSQSGVAGNNKKKAGSPLPNKPGQYTLQQPSKGPASASQKPLSGR